MRLWHKDLIPVLPRQQLVSQWRECMCIARNLAVNGTPNHLLVNRILDYPSSDFRVYSYLVMIEMKNRGYKVQSFEKFCDFYKQWEDNRKNPPMSFAKGIFFNWHNDRYLLQCYRNLQEKHDCGGVPDDEWMRFLARVSELLEGAK